MKVRAVIVRLGLLRFEAFVRRPGFDQRAINREVLVRQKRFHLLMFEKLGHKLLEHIAFLKAFAVLGSGPRSDRPARGRRTSEIADCSRAAPSAGARSGPNRAPAKSARLTAAQAGSTVGLRASRASRTYGSTPSRPRGRVRGFCARDGTRESASQDECTKTSRLDPEIVRASTVLPPNQGRTESPLFRSGEVFQQTARGDTTQENQNRQSSASLWSWDAMTSAAIHASGTATRFTTVVTR